MQVEVQTMAEKLTGNARKTALAELMGWSEVTGRDAISRKFAFKDFSAAIAFVNRLADDEPPPLRELRVRNPHRPPELLLGRGVQGELLNYSSGGAASTGQ